VRAFRNLLPAPGHSITAIAEMLGMSPGTLGEHVPALRELRATRAGGAAPVFVPMFLNPLPPNG